MTTSVVAGARHRARRAWVLPAALGALVVAGQVLYPHFEGTARDRATMAIVVLFAAASVADAARAGGRRAALTLVAVAGGGGLAVEALGVATGFPFGAYAYGDALGVKILGVPWVIPLAWTMMAWPALLVGRRLATNRLAGALVAGWALASWDLFLDPQMVAEGYWTWASGGGPHVLGGIPVTNFLGWLVVGVAMQAVLWRVVPTVVDDRVGIALWLWTWIGAVVAAVGYLGLPAAGVAAGIGMGVVGVPLVVTLVRER